jgi:hypothetical protein
MTDPMERNADYERGFIDGRADQMKSSVDKAVNRMAQREWVGLTKEECWELLVAHKEKPFSFLIAVEAKLKEKNTYTAPVHASDISQERVDETAKRKHEWVGLDGDIPGLGLVTEEFYNGMLCAEDILRKRNT